MLSSFPWSSLLLHQGLSPICACTYLPHSTIFISTPLGCCSSKVLNLHSCLLNIVGVVLVVINSHHLSCFCFELEHVYIVKHGITQLVKAYFLTRVEYILFLKYELRLTSTFIVETEQKFNFKTLCHLSYVHFGIKYPFSSPYDNVSLLN
uniref:Uncharacterized protein n=1 Tax=Cucumis melo TaxID=3656 RepID=A0A9I9EBS3_CUCME